MAELFKNLYWADIGQACLDTLSMLGAALGFTVLLGLPLGVLLFLTGKRQLHEAVGVYRVLSVIVNMLRSLPFIILLIVLIPLTTLLVGTSLGVPGTIPPLVVGCTPFFARLVETALREVDRGWWRRPRPWAPTLGKSSASLYCPRRGRAAGGGDSDRHRAGGLHRDGRCDRRRRSG
jgi:ABC-type methionine transport system permease subunit